MNWFHVLVLAFICVGGPILITRAIRHDRNLAALEALDDERLAAEAADSWNRGDWS